MDMEVIIERTTPHCLNFRSGNGSCDHVSHPNFIYARHVAGYYIYILSKNKYPAGKISLRLSQLSNPLYYMDTSPAHESEIKNRDPNATASEPGVEIPTPIIVQIESMNVTDGQKTEVTGKVFYIQNERQIPPDLKSVFAEGAKIKIITIAPPDVIRTTFENAASQTYTFSNLQDAVIKNGVIECRDPRPDDEIKGTKAYQESLRPRF